MLLLIVTSILLIFSQTSMEDTNSHLEECLISRHLELVDIRYACLVAQAYHLFVITKKIML